jgi:hypothetical protein
MPGVGRVSHQAGSGGTEPGFTTKPFRCTRADQRTPSLLFIDRIGPEHEHLLPAPWLAGPEALPTLPRCRTGVHAARRQHGARVTAWFGQSTREGNAAAFCDARGAPDPQGTDGHVVRTIAVRLQARRGVRSPRRLGPRLQRGDVDSLRALVTGLGVEGDLRALGQ